MIACLLLLSLVTSSFAKPIFDPQRSNVPLTEKVRILDQESETCLTIGLQAHNCDNSIKSADLITRSLQLGESDAEKITASAPNALSQAQRQRNIPPQPHSVLIKRTFNPPGHPLLQLTKFRSITGLLPAAPTLVNIASYRLKEFYDIIALRIETGAFKSFPPSKNIVLDLWDFELIITCDKMPVPWSFVQAWVIDMADLSGKTFTGFYEATVRGEGTLSGLVFLIYMRLKDGTGLGKGT